MKGLAGALTILALAMGSAGLAAPQTNAAALAQDDAARGRELYVRNGCYQCHGFVGQGAATGPRLAPDPMPFALFSRIVYEPLDLMPRYGPQFVSEQDLRDLYAYLQTIPPSPSADEIPLLRD